MPTNTKPSGTIGDTQKTMTISATSFRGCNRFSPMLSAIAQQNLFSEERLIRIILPALLSSQSLLDQVILLSSSMPMPSLAFQYIGVYVAEFAICEDQKARGLRKLCRCNVFFVLFVGQMVTDVICMVAVGCS